MSPKKQWIFLALIVYSVLLMLLCFSPQQQLLTGVEVPGIQHFGRIVVLLVPFNSLVQLDQVDSLWELLWIFLQNALNILLLFPLLVFLLYLFPSLRKKKRVLFLSFAISLGIETTQVLLDIFLDFNRVFEIDDLWTNTLGGYLAYRFFRWTYQK